jgi:MinD superfamily P-loop ATPase
MASSQNIKQITVVSGKGGTGKTSIITSLAYNLKNSAILADADVTAADISIIFPSEESLDFEYKGMKKAAINEELCTKCGLCSDHCRFYAIDLDFKVNEMRCEGCSLCYHLCPESAISMNEKVSGYYYISDTRIGKIIHAKLNPGEKNSGLLVAEVRKKAKAQAETENKRILLIDGSPGIGCPVISSLTGTDLMIAVTEPTLSGKHDLERLIILAEQMKLKSFVIVNRYDINDDITRQIEIFCEKKTIPYVKIPYNPAFVEAMVEKKTLSEIESDLREVKAIQKKLLEISDLIKN